MTDKPLTQKQENFCLFYVELDNASEAYRRAYDVDPDCDPNTIWSNACQLKSDTKVSQRIGELRSNLTERMEISVERVLSELAGIGFAKQEEKSSDRINALDKLGKHLGMFNDKLEVTGKDGKDLVPEREPRDIARAIVAVLNQAKVKEATE